MRDSLDVGTFLIMEGALVLGLVIARVGCLRVADLALMPAAIRQRVDRMTRLTPVIAAVSVALIVAGLVV